MATRVHRTMMDVSLGKPLSTEEESPPLPSSLTVAVWGQGLGDVPLSTLEKTVVRLSPRFLRDLFARHPMLREVGCVRTCQRLEVYSVLPEDYPVDSLRDELGGVSEPWSSRTGFDAIHHLYRVAYGLDSLAIGEREIQDQITTAAKHFLSRSSRPLLRDLMKRAAQSARTADALTPGEEAPSMAVLAVQALRASNKTPHPHVLVVGAGTMGKKVTSLLSSEARVTLVYRHRAPSAAFLRTTHCRTISRDRLRTALESTDALITATKGGYRLFEQSDFPRETSKGPSVVIDLGMPRNVDPAVARRSGISLWDIERLRKEMLSRDHGRPFLRREQAARRDAETASQFFSRHAWEPVIARIWRQAEAIREAEVAQAMKRVPKLTLAERQVLHRMSERLVRRLLSRPTERLRRISETSVQAEAVRIALALFEEPDAP